ncbi:hypothetical protein CspHIS471_0705500 [Cutaneotrichosporon sp. HIS471]|nr:hypothetical protein CspHIS471_0705500 [Cutaneotrichosporon sp. HIS471]
MADILHLLNLDIFNFTGGTPQPPDLAPSIVFAALYGLALPVLIWRVSNRASRTWLLLQPATFLLLRLSMYILRAIMSVHPYDIHYLSGEASLVNISFLILLFPVLDLWRLHILTTVQRKNRPKWVRPVIPYVTLLVSIILSIVTATKVDPTGPTSSLVRGLWRANYILSVSTVAMGLIYVPLCHFLMHLGLRGSIYLMFLLSLCFITAVYRVIQLHTLDPHAPVRSRAAFYILEGASDWICLAAILAININVWYPGELAWKKEPYEPDEAAMTAPSTDTVSVLVNSRTQQV